MPEYEELGETTQIAPKQGISRFATCNLRAHKFLLRSILPFERSSKKEAGGVESSCLPFRLLVTTEARQISFWLQSSSITGSADEIYAK